MPADRWRCGGPCARHAARPISPEIQSHAAPRHLRADGIAGGHDRASGRSSTDMYLPSLPDIARQLGASTAQVQLTISSYLIGFAVGQIVYGPLSDRHGRKPVLLAALALVLRGDAGLRAVDLDRDADRRALRAGARRLRRHRAGARDRARSLFRRARRPRIVADGRDHGAGAGGRAAARRRAADRFRLALGLRRAGRRRPASAPRSCWLLLPETLRQRARRAGVAGLDAQRPIAWWRATRPISPISAWPRPASRGLFAWISGASFVLQDLYGLSPFEFGVAFAVGSVGYMIGTTLAARLVMRLGHRPHDRRRRRARWRPAGSAMVLAVALGSDLGRCRWCCRWRSISPASAWCCRRRMAGAMTPFPERAGAASSLLGFIQQSASALCGAMVGWLLGQTRVAARRRGGGDGLRCRCCCGSRRARCAPAPD